MRKIILLVSLLLSLAACGPKKVRQAPAQPVRSFPRVEVPAMITKPVERYEYAAQHFWEPFLKESFPTDSLQLNGIPKEEVEKQMGVFTSILREISPAAGEEAMVSYFNSLSAFQAAHLAEGPLLRGMADLTARYLYDPTSPVRSEELYLPFVSRLAASELVEPAWRMGYQWDARMCALNRPGTPAADFVFIDTQGKRRTLYGIPAERLLLIFGNPDCTACRQLMESMEEEPDIQELISSGRLKVVDIYIDEDIALWKQRMAGYPANWINGYDPTFTIRQDLIYNVRALPSLYLLDRDKTVLAKDAEPDDVMALLLARP